MLVGKLNPVDIVHIFNYVDKKRASGALTLRHRKGRAAREARVYFNRGLQVIEESSQVRQRMGDVQISQGIIDQAQLDKRLEIQNKEGHQRRLGIILCSVFSIDRDRIETTLAKLYISIANEVFHWESGDFVLTESNEHAQCDLFSLAPAGFIPETGIDAGALTEEDSKRA